MNKAIKIILFPIKLVFKICLIPLIILMATIVGLMKMIKQIGEFAIGLVMLFFLIYIAICLKEHNWLHAGIFFMMEFFCTGLTLGYSMIVMLLEKANEFMMKGLLI